MPTRSLFSPFSSSANLGGVGRLFRPSLASNPEYEDLLKYGAYDPELDASVKPFIARGGLFGSGSRYADEANALALNQRVQAKFASDLARKNALAEIQARGTSNVEQAKAIADYQRQQQEVEELKNFGIQGVTLENILGSFSPEIADRVIPKNYSGIGIEGPRPSPVDLSRFYNQLYGGKTAVASSQQVGLEDFGGGKLDTLRGIVSTPTKFLPTQSISQFKERTGRMTINEAGEQIPETRDVTKTTHSYKTIPGGRSILPNLVTKDEAKDIPEEEPEEEPTLEEKARNIVPQAPPQVQAKPTTENAGSLLDLFKIPASGLMGNGQILRSKLPQKQVEPPKEEFKNFESIVRGFRLDDSQKEMFNTLVKNYIKANGKEPGFFEARNLAQVVINMGNRTPVEARPYMNYK